MITQKLAYREKRNTGVTLAASSTLLCKLYSARQNVLRLHHTYEQAPRGMPDQCTTRQARLLTATADPDRAWLPAARQPGPDTLSRDHARAGLTGHRAASTARPHVPARSARGSRGARPRWSAATTGVALNPCRQVQMRRRWASISHVHRSHKCKAVEMQGFGAGDRVGTERT